MLAVESIEVGDKNKLGLLKLALWPEAALEISSVVFPEDILLCEWFGE